MDYLIQFEDGSDGYLSHHGVLGMKWGVRNAETLRRYANEGGKKPTKRQVKSAIRQKKREYRKSTGAWMTTGKHQAAVDRKVRDAAKNDSELKKHLETRDAMEKKIRKEEEKINTTKLRKDHLTRLQQDPEASTVMRRAAEKDYLSAKEKSRKSRDKIAKAQAIYDDADWAYGERSRAIAKSYRSQYEDATVRDLGFDNVQKGKALLQEYGLMDKALRWKAMRSHADSQ